MQNHISPSFQTPFFSLQFQVTTVSVLIRSFGFQVFFLKSLLEINTQNEYLNEFLIC